MGEIQVVTRFHSFGSECPCCGDINTGKVVVFMDELGEWGCPIPWVKRIPPLSELEGERAEENLKEPA